MKKLSLQLASLLCYVAVLYWIWYGVTLVVTGSLGLGIASFICGIPLSIAFATVFDYVQMRLEDDVLLHKKERARQLGKPTGDEDVDGTPWQFG